MSVGAYQLLTRLHKHKILVIAIKDSNFVLFSVLGSFMPLSFLQDKVDVKELSP